MKISAFLSFYEKIEPQSYEDFLQERINTADSEASRELWTDLWDLNLREETK